MAKDLLRSFIAKSNEKSQGIIENYNPLKRTFIILKDNNVSTGQVFCDKRKIQMIEYGLNYMMSVNKKEYIMILYSFTVYMKF